MVGVSFLAAVICCWAFMAANGVHGKLSMYETPLVTFLLTPTPLWSSRQ